MITQEYLNGYVTALGTLESTYESELLLSNLTSDQKEVIKSHLNQIKNIKSSYKELIAQLNQQVKK